MSPAATTHTTEALEELYYRLLRIRRAEERVVELYPSDKITSPVHLSLGQEAVAVGVYSPAVPGDLSFATYRSHAAYLAAGGTMRGMFAELYGKVTGVTRGKGGSMHLVCPEKGLLGSSAVVGSCLPVALGAAFALQQRRQPFGVAVFFGDGAVEEGVFFESLNYAALRKLPLFLVCENNLYAIHSRTAQHHAFKHLTDTARLFHIPHEVVDGTDVLAVETSARRAWEHVRAGHGPIFMEYTCYRYREHVGVRYDYSFGYRSQQELQEWQARDPVEGLARRLAPERAKAIEQRVREEIDDAVAFAETSPFPADEELYQHVYR